MAGVSSARQIRHERKEMSAHKNVLIALVLAGITMFALKDSSQGATEATGSPKWQRVQIVTYAAGLTGFFDTSNGRLYLYGADLKTPFAITELEKLGDPLKVIKAPGT